MTSQGLETEDQPTSSQPHLCNRHQMSTELPWLATPYAYHPTSSLGGGSAVHPVYCRDTGSSKHGPPSACPALLPWLTSISGGRARQGQSQSDLGARGREGQLASPFVAGQRVSTSTLVGRQTEECGQCTRPLVRA
jgi:hypothetical protein